MNGGEKLVLCILCGIAFLFVEFLATFGGEKRCFKSLEGTENEGPGGCLPGSKVLIYGGCDGCEACPHLPWWRATVNTVDKSNGRWVVEYDLEKVVATKQWLGIFAYESGFRFERTVTVVGSLGSMWWTDTASGDSVLCDWIEKRLRRDEARHIAKTSGTMKGPDE